jgi:hypothetical protein
MVTVFVLL